MDVFSQLAEERIKQAIQDGDFEDIKGKGKPQKKDPLEHVPAELRMGYRIMKNSGYLPEEVQINKELASLRDLLKLCTDDQDKKRIEKRITEKELQFQLLLEKRNIKQTSSYKRYSSKINRLF
ncbi:J-domain-containing protein [Gracilibacillus sp. D59]|uniref:DnaJ family domain-containing protein n=1 Tax=Gracilibacillus sp. D59 TaxID=3457434 RepID=UPI003FCC4E62